jgi:hypothetical protein
LKWNHVVVVRIRKATILALEHLFGRAAKVAHNLGARIATVLARCFPVATNTLEKGTFQRVVTTPVPR